MFKIVAKLAILSAVLSAGVVTAYDRAVAQKGDKIYTERVQESAPEARIVLASAASVRTDFAPVEAARPAPATAPKSDRLSGPVNACADQTWPYIDRDCLAAAAGTPTRTLARVVTMERRDAPNTSTLVRVSPVTVAVR